MKEGIIAKLAREGEEAYRTKDAQKFADWLIPNVALVLGALKLLAEIDAGNGRAWVDMEKMRPSREQVYITFNPQRGYDILMWETKRSIRSSAWEDVTHWREFDKLPACPLPQNCGQSICDCDPLTAASLDVLDDVAWPTKWMLRCVAVMLVSLVPMLLWPNVFGPIVLLSLFAGMILLAVQIFRLD